MAELFDLDTTASNNTARFPENMQFRNVNDSARELEAMLARDFKDTNGTLTTSGSSNAYTLTPNRTILSLTDGLNIAFKANHTNTGSATLNVSGLGAKTIVRPDGVTNLVAGDLVSGARYRAIYNTTSQAWQLVSSPSVIPASSADVLARVVKAGSIVAWAHATLPAGWLECNGAAISRTTYAELYSILGTTYGAGDGSTTFNIPDYRGQFLRGKDGGAAVDPDRTARTNRGDGTTGDAVGTKQTSAVVSHSHTFSGSGSTSTTGAHGHQMSFVTATVYATGGSGQALFSVGSGSANNTSTDGDHAHTVTVSGTTNNTGTSTETRPTNVGVIFIILALPAAAATGAMGVQGLSYRFSASTSGNPGTGRILVNNATLASATALNISETDDFGAGMSAFLATWDDSTSTTKGHIHFWKVGDPSTFAIYAVSGTLTDSGTYDEFTVSHVASNGTFATGDYLSVLFYRTGDRGDAGTPGGLTLANGVNSDIAIDGKGFCTITGPTAAFSTTGFAAGSDGQVLRVYNSVAFDWTITNDATSTAANRILTLTGANVTLTGVSAATFVYSSTSSRWILFGTQG